MMSAGISHSLDLICSTVTSPGDTVVVEAPTYFLAHRIFEDHKLKVVEADFSTLGGLEQAIERYQPSLAYCVPTYQNPGGTTLTLERRREIVSAARSAGLTLVSDEAYQLLHFPNAEPPPPPLAEIDRVVNACPEGGESRGAGGAVLSCGSFSKIVAPGFRLGWIEGDVATLDKVASRGYLVSGD
jgi:DNA-binding transcriptional MocR family regulator